MDTHRDTAATPDPGRTAGVMVVVLCLAAIGLNGLVRPYLWALLAGTGVALLVAVLASGPRAIGLGLASLLWVGGLWGLANWWPVPLVVMLVGYGLALWGSPRLRGGAPWLGWGRADRITWLVTGLFVVTSAVALVLWTRLSGYDVSGFRALVPATDAPKWLMFVGLWPYAMLNAAAEEVLFRGALWEQLRILGSRPWVINAVQAACFGLAHYAGFPGGWSGVALATIYGLMMGILRQRSGAIAVPWLAHVFADVTIYSLVVAMV